MYKDKTYCKLVGVLEGLGNGKKTAVWETKQNKTELY